MHRRCAVLGSPISHSLSPLLHRAAYEALGLAWAYDAIEMDEAALPAFLDGLGSEWRGLSLTMPLKRAVLPLLDAAGELVHQTGAANTLLLEDGRRRGENTDVPGIVDALAQHGVVTAGSALVLGGGATAAAALAALREIGVRAVVVAVREPARTGYIVAAAGRLGVSLTVLSTRDLAAALAPTEVVVSTVPAAAAAGLAPLLAQRCRVVLDVVYDPWPTPLLRTAAGHGRVAVSGLDLLLHQAAAQDQLRTGRPAPLTAMRDAAQRRTRCAAGCSDRTLPARAVRARLAG